MQEQEPDHSPKDHFGSVLKSSSSVAVIAHVCNPSMGGEEQPWGFAEGVADPTLGVLALPAAIHYWVSCDLVNSKGIVVTAVWLCLMQCKRNMSRMSAFCAVPE